MVRSTHLRTLRLCVAYCLALAAASGTIARAEVAVKHGQRIAFLGDSITEAGWRSPAGYVRLVVLGLEANGIGAVAVPAGVSGHKSNQMLARLDRDVLAKKPDWMALSCGVNDVWHGANGVPLEAYRTNITAIVEQAQAAGVNVMILTATVIEEELDNDNNRKLAPYNDFLRTLARERKCLLADLNADFQKALGAAQGAGEKGRLLTSDGVHMNGQGNLLMAVGVLRAFGLDDAQVAKAREKWLDVPGTEVVRASFDAGEGRVLRATWSASGRQRQKLESLAKRREETLAQLADSVLAEEVKSILKPEGVDRIFETKREKSLESLLTPGFARRLEELTKD